MEQMHALVKSTPSLTELRQVPIPEPDASQVLIRVAAAALCGTDLHVHRWNLWARSAGIALPVVMGHECCGEVVAVGAHVAGVQAGDRIAVETHIPCGKCRQCLNGQQHICHNLKLFSIHTNGCFAQYAVVPAVCARKIPDEIPSRVAAVMEPLGTALRCAVEARVAGAVVVILGCGPIGLFAAAAAAALGAARVIASDLSPFRLEIAARMGADTTLNPGTDDVVKTVLASTGGYGADVVIDASGSAPAVRQAFQCLRKGGRIVLVGLPDQPLELEIGKEVVFKEATIAGIHGRTMFETWTQMENLLVSGKIDALPAITHVLPLDRWQEGFDLALSGTACKVVFEP
jgi:threonine 3-dehydrogenase